MVVTLTVGLSIATRSITNIRLSTEEQDSQRAFSAAEAGIDRAIKANSNIAGQNLGNDAFIKQVAVTSLSGSSFIVNNGLPALRDDGADIWLVSHNSDETPNYTGSVWGNTPVEINWGQASDVCSAGSDNTAAALEIIVMTGPVATPKAIHLVYDPCDGSSGVDRTASNRFSPVSTTGDTISTVQFANKVIIPSATVQNGLFIRIIPLYANTLLGVRSAVALPVQGTIYDSRGTAGSTERRITTFRGFPRLPTEFFPYMIFVPQS